MIGAPSIVSDGIAEKALPSASIVQRYVVSKRPAYAAPPALSPGVACAATMLARACSARSSDSSRSSGTSTKRGSP